MIAILGATEDDILYFVTKARIERTEDLYGGSKVYFTHLFSEEVLLAAVGKSNVKSALLTGILIERYDPYLLFEIGTCSSFRRELRQGDIFVADRVYQSDVDFTEEGPYSYGQIPGDPNFYVTDVELSDLAEQESYLVSSRYVQRGYILSGNKFYAEASPLDWLLRERFLKEDSLRAYDSTSGGVAAAASLRKIPFVILLAVSYEIGHDDQRLSYKRKGLEASPTVGKILSRVLLEKGTKWQE